MKESSAAAQYINPVDLVPWDKNPRRNTEAIEPVMASIKEFGFATPIVARAATREIIAGHTRWRAAMTLGLKEVPVRFLDVTEEQAHRLALADNKLGEIADWDTGVLASVVQELAATDGALAATGFSEAEIAQLLAASTDDFLAEFGTPASESVEAVAPAPEATSTDVEWVTFSLKVTAAQDVQLHEALALAKRRFGVHTNVDALLKMCELLTLADPGS